MTRSADANVLMHIGWLDLHRDASMNFQLNRWLAYGGESWLADVRPVLPNLQGFEAWRDELVALGERAESAGRLLVPSDPRKTPTRRRLTALLREALRGPGQ